MVPTVVGGEEDVSGAHHPCILQLAYHPLYQVIDRLQGLDPLFVEVVYVGLRFGAEPRQLSYPGGFVRDVPFVEGGQAWCVQAVEGVCVARGRCGRQVRSYGRHVSEEGFAQRGTVADECVGLPTEHVGFVVALSCTVVPYGAVVVDIVVEVAEFAAGAIESGEPPIPSQRNIGGVVVTVEVLADEGGPVASVV